MNCGADGELLTLEEQDRSRWNRAEIARAIRAPGGEHALPRRRQLGGGDGLAAFAPSPIVDFNRAIAVGMRDEPEVGLALVDSLTLALRGFRLLPAAQADMLARCGRIEQAASRYRQAIALTESPPERAQLMRHTANRDGRLVVDLGRDGAGFLLWPVAAS